MLKYKNITGSSSIVGYSSGMSYIEIYYDNGYVFKYTEESIGKTHLEELKRLAELGFGLNDYIKTHCYNKHVSREKYKK